MLENQSPKLNRMLDSGENAASGDCAHVRREHFHNAEQPTRRNDARDDDNLDGRTSRIVINYEVNVNAFYKILSKRLDNVQLDLQRVKQKSENRLLCSRSS
mmetsp:Transcript_19012/g.35474  ORF Transcript_19012/g.35474 Transcript_19012/m.35474 type:complete len:101 (+) Transcript_19012:1820-2122(+)